MRLILLVPVVLAACATDAEPTDTGEPWVAPLAAPFVAITASTFDGAFRSTCTMAGSVIDADGNEVSSITLDPADGGFWAGVVLDPGEQRKIVLSWNDCVNNDNGTGEFTSGVFSGQDGDLFVAHYNGSTSGLEWMVQGTDHLGGEVHAQFDPDVTVADIDDFVAGLGLASEPDPDDESFRFLSWTDTTNVVDVLASLRGNENFFWGEPAWVAQPSWW